MPHEEDEPLPEWREAYISLLTNGPRDPKSLSNEKRDKQRVFVAQLIESGYVNGVVDHDARGEISGFVWAGVTTTGNVFCEELQRPKQSQEKFDHTLLNYWRRGNAGERFGLISAFIFAFSVGYVAAHNRVISRIIDDIRALIP